jgi:hypothetical protein
VPQNSQILLIRHGEKPNSQAETGLSVAGQARSMAYVVYFQNFEINSKPIKIDHLFATAPTDHSNRPYLTIQPLAQQLDLKINNQFNNTDQDIAALVKFLLDEQQFNNSNILVCWHHERLLEMAAALGALKGTLPVDWSPEIFGWVILLSYGAKGEVISSTVIQEKLMFGDQPTA